MRAFSLPLVAPYLEYFPDESLRSLLPRLLENIVGVSLHFVKEDKPYINSLHEQNAPWAPYDMSTAAIKYMYNKYS